MDTLYIALKHSHNLLRWFVLLTAIYAVFRHAMGFFKKGNYTPADDKSGLFYMIACDVQLLIAIVLYLKSTYFDMLLHDTKMVMQTAEFRYFAVEHFAIMLTAIAFVHIGRATSKNLGKADNIRFRNGLIFFGISLLLILHGIPWDRALMPGM